MERILDFHRGGVLNLSLWNLNTSTAFLILSFLCTHFAKYIYCVCIYYKYILYLSTDRCIHYYKKRVSCYTNFTFTLLYIYIYIYITLPPLHLVQRINQSQWTAIVSPGGLNITLTLEASNRLRQTWTPFLLSVDFQPTVSFFERKALGTVVVRQYVFFSYSLCTVHTLKSSPGSYAEHSSAP